MRLPLSRPLLYAFYALFSCPWLHGATAEQTSATPYQAQAPVAATEERQDQPRCQNLFRFLPDDLLYLALGPFLSDQDLGRMLVVCKGFGGFKKVLDKIFKQVAWDPAFQVTSQDYKQAVDEIAAWAALKLPTHPITYKTLCICRKDIPKVECYERIHYVHEPAVQNSVTRLLIKAPQSVPYDLNFLSGFSKLSTLQLEFLYLPFLQGLGFPNSGHYKNLKTLVLTLQRSHHYHFEESFNWLARWLIGLETLKLFYDCCTLPNLDALRALHLRCLWLRFTCRNRYFEIKGRLDFLRECTHIQELRISGLHFGHYQEAKDFCHCLQPLIHLRVLELAGMYVDGTTDHRILAPPYRILTSDIGCVDSSWINWRAFQELEELSLKNWLIRRKVGIQNKPGEGLTSLQGLSVGTKLRRLDCTGCALLTNISAITKFPQLEFLNLEGCTALRLNSLPILRSLPKQVEVILPPQLQGKNVVEEASKVLPNYFLKIPETAHLCIGSFLADEDLARMLATWQGFNLMQRFFQRLQGGTFDPAVYRLTIAGLETWARWLLPKDYQPRKTLYITAPGVKKQGLHKLVPYVERPLIQQTVTKLVVQAPGQSPDDLNFLLKFQQLTSLKLDFLLFLAQNDYDTIGQCNGLTTLILTLRDKEPLDLGFSSRLTALDTLKLNLQSGCQGLSVLGGLAKLRVLWLSFQPAGPEPTPGDLSGLRTCTQLQELKISGLQLSNAEGAKVFCEAIEQLINLTGLALENIHYVQRLNDQSTKVYCMPSDLLHWSAFKDLQVLSLRHEFSCSGEQVEGLQSLAPLAGCAASLRRLDCKGSRFLTDISVLTQLKQLTFVDLTGCKALQPASLAMLSTLPKEVTVIVPQHCKELRRTSYVKNDE